MNRFIWSLAALLTVSPLVGGTLATTPFRVEWSQSGSVMTVSLQDIDKTPVRIDVPTKVTIESVNGTFRVPRGKWSDSWQATIDPGKGIPPLELRSDSLLSSDMTLIATITPAGGTAVQSTKSITLQPYPFYALLLAIAGALAGALYSFFTGVKTWPRFLGRIAGGIVVGVLVFAAARFDVIWKLVGLSPETFVLQTYFFLGFVIAYRGVPWFLGKVTGDDKQSDGIRSAIREEIQKTLVLDPGVLRQTPQMIDRVQQSLIAAKYGEVAPDFLEFLQPRLDEIYTISHRENFNTTLDIKLGDSWFEWNDVTSFNLIRNPNDLSTGPGVRYSHMEDVPEALKKEGKEKLEQIGTMVLSLGLKISTDRDGELVYEGTSDNRLLRKNMPAGCDAPPHIDVTLAYNPEKSELLFAYDFDLLPPFKGKESVTIEQSACWRGKAEDGIYSVKLGRLTLGYHLRYRFTPDIRDDRVLFVWKSLRDQYKHEEKKPGIVDLNGWLLPGNGVCLAYSGTGRIRSISPAVKTSDAVS